MILTGIRPGKTLIWNEDLTTLATLPVHEMNQALWNKYMSFLAEKDEYSSVSWLGVPGGVAELREKVELKGWSEGVSIARKLIRKFEVPSLPHFRRKRIKSSQGHALDIHAVYRGDLSRAWESSKREQIRNCAMRGYVNIIIDVGVNSSSDNNKYFWRGACGCILAEALINSGRNVRIIAVDCTSEIADSFIFPDSKKLIVAVVIKKFQECFDINKLFSFTALSGFLRYYFFKASYAPAYQARNSFGSSTNFEAEDIEDFLDGSTCITISNLWSHEQVNDRLGQLAEQIRSGKFEE